MAKISSIIQPLVPGQTHATSLGQLLSAGRGEEVYLSTAYIREAGVTTIAKQLRKRAGKAKAFVGIANGATSLQGIQALFRTGIRIWLVDTGSRERIFHPKFYSTKDRNAVHAIIGSANLTHPGLHNNIEFGASLELDLRDRSDSEFYSSITQALESLPTRFPDNCFPLRSLKHARELADERRLVDERIIPEPDAAPEARGSAPPRPGRTTRRMRLPYTPAPTRPRRAPAAGPPAAPPTQAQAVAPVGQLVWEKPRLPQGDLQILQVGHTSGVLRLTQAGFLLGGRRIDQTTYFRRTVFASLQWSEDPRDPEKEIAYGQFRLIVLGRTVGEFSLKLSHKPSWEAGQHNYTTGLHWGDAVRFVRQPRLVGQRLHLFAPAMPMGPFVIQIG